MLLLIITFKGVCIIIVILKELTHKTIKWKSITTDILRGNIMYLDQYVVHEILQILIKTTKTGLS